MDCEWMILCDSAHQDLEKKTCIIGIRYGFGVKSTPATCPSTFLVLGLRGTPNEVAEVTVEVIEPTGESLGGPKGRSTLNRLGMAEMFVRFAMMPLRHIGTYRIKVSIDGSVKRSGSFVVENVPG